MLGIFRYNSSTYYYCCKLIGAFLRSKRDWRPRVFVMPHVTVQSSGGAQPLTVAVYPNSTLRTYEHQLPPSGSQGVRTSSTYSTYCNFQHPARVNTTVLTDRVRKVWKSHRVRSGWVILTRLDPTRTVRFNPTRSSPATIPGTRYHFCLCLLT